jgi:hypothetical protein
LKQSVIGFFAGAAVAAAALYGTIIPSIRSKALSTAQHQSEAYQSQIEDLQAQLQSLTPYKNVRWDNRGGKPGLLDVKAHVSGSARILDSQPQP